MFRTSFLGSAGLISLSLAGLLALSGFVLAQTDDQPSAPNKVQSSTTAETDGFDPAKSDAKKTSSREMSTWVNDASEALARIEYALSKKTDLVLNEVRFEDAVRMIAEQADIPVVVDERAIEEVGLSLDEVVSIPASNLTLESAMNLMLRDLDLTYTIDDEVLQITTREADEGAHLLTRIYWAGDDGLEVNNEGVQMIQMMVEPETWDVLGGPSVLWTVASPGGDRGGFVASTTYRVHKEIERFLEALRAGGRGKLSAPAAIHSGGFHSGANSGASAGDLGGGGIF